MDRIAAEALVLQKLVESNAVLAAKIAAGTLFLSYAVKYGSLGLNTPFEANRFVALAMVLGIPALAALSFYQRGNSPSGTKEGEFKPFSF